MKLEDVVARLADFTGDAILITEANPLDRPGPRIVWCNPAFTRMTGYTLEDIAGLTPRILQGPDTDPEAVRIMAEGLRDWQETRVELQNYTRDGDAFWVEIALRPVPDASGQPQYWVAVQRDVTASKRREKATAARLEALRTSERHLQERWDEIAGIAAVAEHSQDLITITDPNFRILWANPAFEARTGFPLVAARGQTHCDLLCKQAVNYSSREAAVKALLFGDYRSGEARNTTRDGEHYWTDIRVSVQRDIHGRAQRFVVVERDITEQRRQREQLEQARRDLEQAANHDALTGLLNRRGLQQKIAAATGGIDRVRDLAVIHLDLDRFKEINDTFGHAVGDLVLVEATRRIRARLGPEDLAARVGGDEFLIVRRCPGVCDGSSTFALAEDLASAMAEPLQMGDLEYRWGASAGVAVAEPEGETFDDLMVRADIALYRAKADGRRRAVLFTDDLRQRTHSRKVMADQLIRSIETDGFEVHYQPQVCARAGTLTGAEALVRWRDPEGALVAPERFLPLAQDIGIVNQIDAIVLVRAAADLAAWQAAGLHLPRVAVNVSARRLLDPDLLDDIDALGLDGRRLAVELVESTFLDQTSDQVAWNIDGLRERGIALEIDDFGTGHASIAGLMRIRPDRLKIDRSFIGPIVEDAGTRRIVALIVELARVMGIQVVAEGIETAAHAACARDLGCDVLQGFYHSRPLAAADLPGFSRQLRGAAA